MNQITNNSKCGDCDRNELQALHEIARLLASGHQQREIMENILHILEEQVGMLRGTIMLLLPDNTELVVEATRPTGNDVKGHARYLRGEGIMGRVVEENKPVIVPDITEEPEFQNRIHRRDHSKEPGLSFVCVPVSLEREVVGALAVDIPHSVERPLKQSARVINIVGAMIASHLRSQRLLRLERESWENENRRLRTQLGEQYRPDSIIGNSSKMKEVFNRIKILSESDTTVLVRGPSGTGKELIASAIHYAGKRKDRPLVKVNCAALSENLVESELFGHEKGAFSGALYTRKGRIEEAEGGTLFLDEIGDFSLNTQVKLLRVIQERQYERVGSNETKNANIRLIAATNKNLEDAVAKGGFREDLYYRINVFPIHLPALRERKDDILLLANHFVKRYAEKMDRTVSRISTPAINMLLAYHWPGNVRELENCIEYAVLLAADGVIYGHNLPPTLQIPDQNNITATAGLKNRTRTLEYDMIIDALKRTNGNVAAAARDLEITARMVRYKIKQMGIDPKQLVRPRGA